MRRLRTYIERAGTAPCDLQAARGCLFRWYPRGAPLAPTAAPPFTTFGVPSRAVMPYGPPMFMPAPIPKGDPDGGCWATGSVLAPPPKAARAPPAIAPAGPPERNPAAAPPSTPSNDTFEVPEGGDGSTGGEKFSGEDEGGIPAAGLPPVAGPWRMPGSGCHGRTSRALMAKDTGRRSLLPEFRERCAPRATLADGDARQCGEQG